MLLFSSPHTQSLSKTSTNDFPLSVSEYSTFGGICGYSFRTIRLSASNSFKFTLSVLSETVFHKLEKSGLTASKAETVDAPVINEFPLCLECEFIEYQNNEYGCDVIGKVISITADERVMLDGKLDMTLVNAIAFDPYTHGYYKVAERVGEAFHNGLVLKSC